MRAGVAARGRRASHRAPAPGSRQPSSRRRDARTTHGSLSTTVIRCTRWWATPDPGRPRDRASWARGSSCRLRDISSATLHARPATDASVSAVRGSARGAAAGRGSACRWRGIPRWRSQRSADDPDLPDPLGADRVEVLVVLVEWHRNSCVEVGQPGGVRAVRRSRIGCSSSSCGSRARIRGGATPGLRVSC